MLKNKTLIGFVVFYLICVGCGLCQEQFKYSAASRRDPFIPLVTSDGRLLKLDTEQENKSTLLLEGIIYDKSGISYAVVNGNVVKIGDSIADYQVLKIEADKVVFIKEGQTQEIILKKEEE
jgi:hypothetical protein